MANSIKVRAAEKDGTITVKALITHPMEIGGRKDKKTGQEIPAHFIQEVTAQLNGREVMRADWGGGISKNPYLSFKVAGAKGDAMTIAWTDNKGEGDSVEEKVS